MTALHKSLSLLNIVLALDLLSPSVDGCAAGRRKRESASGEEKSGKMYNLEFGFFEADGSLGQRFPKRWRIGLWIATLTRLRDSHGMRFNSVR